MSRTDKDVPFKYREPDYTNCDCMVEVGFCCRLCMQYRNYGPFFSTNFRKGKKALKREGNKRFRKAWKSERYAGRCPFYDIKTVRTNQFFY